MGIWYNLFMIRPIPKKRKVFAWISFALTLLVMLVLIVSALMPGKESAAMSGTVGDKLDDILTDSGADDIKRVEPERMLLTAGGETVSRIELICGAAKTLTASLLPENTSVDFRKIEWESANAKIATVKSGKITAKGVGTTTVTAKVAAKESVFATVEVQVKERPATDLQLAFADGTSSAVLEVGRHIALDADLLPKDATDRTLVYRSEDPAVATVDARGLVCGISEGTVRLFVEHPLSAGALTASVTLEVIPEKTPYVPLRSVNFGAIETLYTGDTGALSAHAVPEDASEAVFVYKSSDPAVLRVDSATGEYKALKRGDATVTATYALGNSIAATVPVKVRNRTLGAALSITGAQNQAEDGGYILHVDAGTAGIRFEVRGEASPLYLRFASSDKEIAEVFEDGTLATYRSSKGAEGGFVTLHITVSDHPDFSEEEGLVSVFEVRLTVEKQAFSAGIRNFGTWIRKLFGHFGAFYVLGSLAALTALLFDNGSIKRRILFGVLLFVGGFLFAGLTEILQLPIFTTGRGASFGDVLIDYMGFFPAAAILYCGTMVILAIVTYVKRHKKAEKE